MDPFDLVIDESIVYNEYRINNYYERIHQKQYINFSTISMDKQEDYKETIYYCIIVLIL